MGSREMYRVFTCAKANCVYDDAARREIKIILGIFRITRTQ